MGGAHTGEPRSQSPDIPRAPSTAGLVLIRGPAPGMSSSVDNVNLNPVHRSGDAAHRQGPWRPATLSGATTTSRAQVRVLGMRQRQAGWWTVQGGPAGHPRAPGTKAQQGHSQEALPPPATSRDTPVLESWGRPLYNVHKRDGPLSVRRPGVESGCGQAPLTHCPEAPSPGGLCSPWSVATSLQDETVPVTSVTW